jgi:hypothetical protein
MVYAVGMCTYVRLSDRISSSSTYRLKAPEPVPGTGGVIYEAVLAVPGTYYYPQLGAWVLTPAETLADEEFVRALRGVAVIDDDQTAHVEGVTTETMQGESIGRVLSARWDPDQQALIGELLIDVQRGLEAVRAGVVGVSIGYEVDIVEEVGDGYTLRQGQRSKPDNVAITRNPRHGVTRLRASDSGADMTHEEVLKQIRLKVGDAADPMAMFESLIQMVITHSTRVAELEKELAARAGAAAAEAGVEVPDEGADATAGAGEETAEEEAAEAKVAEMADAVRAADSLGVVIDPKWSLADLNRELRDRALAAAVKSARTGDAWDRASQAGARQQPRPTITHSPTDV